MKVSIPQSKFIVSFNTNYLGYEVGDTDNTIDYVGDDIDALAQEVIADSPNYPMVFVRVDEGGIVGKFFDATNEEHDCPEALMVNRVHW